MTKDVIKNMGAHMDKTIEALRKEYQKIRTGRANTGLLDEIKVDYYGTLTPLNQLATLAVPEPRTITLQPWEAKIIPAMEKAILNANLGLTPSNDGRMIRLNLPPLTEERRKDIVKQLRKTAEDAKVAARNIRRDSIDELKKLEKDKKITEDDLKRAEKEVQDVTNSHVAKIDEILAHKEKEVMEV
ncbi:MAG TPA: ribosome recycling factor [Geobacteraceae bacterium]|nr:ribosome recycling factor [Geobacteraceae bacterium]